MNIYDEVVKAVKENQNVETKIDSETPLVKLGINSFSFIQIAVLLEDRLNIQFDDDCLDYTAINNIGELAAYVEDKARAAT